MSFLAIAAFVGRLAGAPLGFPSQPGTLWRYVGTVAWTLEGSNIVRSSRVHWESVATYEHRSEAATVVVIRGFPTDLAWYEPGKQPRLTVVTTRPEGLYVHPVPDEGRAQELADAIFRGADPGEHLLHFPPEIGDCAGAIAQRTDAMYCWLVERTAHFKGHAGWSLSFRTNPDHQFLEYVPGVGVTAYTYQHHGTVASAIVHLVGFKSPRG